MATADYIMFNSQLGAIRSNVKGELLADDTGAWVGMLTDSTNVHAFEDASYRINVKGMQLGFEGTLGAEKTNSAAGLFVGFHQGQMLFARQGSAKVNSIMLGGYGRYNSLDGYYFDALLGLSHLDHKIDAQMTSGGEAAGNFHSTSLGSYLEGGKIFSSGGAFIAPYAAMTGFMRDPNLYQLSNGMQIHNTMQKTLSAGVGMRLGYQVSLQNSKITPHLNLALKHTLTDDNKVSINNDRFSPELNGTQGLYQLGVSALLAGGLNVSVDAGYARGHQVEQPWQANIGMSWAF